MAAQKSFARGTHLNELIGRVADGHEVIVSVDKGHEVILVGAILAVLSGRRSLHIFFWQGSHGGERNVWEYYMSMIRYVEARSSRFGGDSGPQRVWFRGRQRPSLKIFLWVRKK